MALAFIDEYFKNIFDYIRGFEMLINEMLIECLFEIVVVDYFLFIISKKVSLTWKITVNTMF